jgi:hypothetical protein
VLFFPLPWKPHVLMKIATPLVSPSLVFALIENGLKLPIINTSEQAIKRIKIALIKLQDWQPLYFGQLNKLKILSEHFLFLLQL